MKKFKALSYISILVLVVGLLGFAMLNAAPNYTQPLYGSYDLVPTADSTDNVAQRDVVGNKSDAAAAGAVTTTESIMAYIKQVVAGVIASDTVVDAILVDTGTTIPGTITTAQASLDVIDAASGASYGHANYIALATGTFDTTGTWSTAASHEIATVTGAVRMLVIAECVTSVSSVSDTGTISLGDDVTADSVIADSTLGSGVMVAGELWVDATLTRTILTRIQMNAVEFCIVGGHDVGYTVGTNALSGGSMVFHIYWTPMDATGAVVVGAGGTL